MACGALQQTTPEEIGILSCKVCELVDEALDREHIERNLNPTPCSPGGATLHRHIRHAEMLYRVRMVEGAAQLEVLMLAGVWLTDDGVVGKAVGPRNKISLSIDACAQSVHAGRTVAIMRE